MEILVENLDFFHAPPTFDPPPRYRCPRSNIAMTFGTKKTRIVCLPSDEKKFKNVFTLFDTIHVLRIYVTDGRTSRRTPHDGIIIIIITTTITITISITEAF